MPRISKRLAKKIGQEVKEAKTEKEKWNFLMGLLGYNQFIIPKKGGEK